MQSDNQMWGMNTFNCKSDIEVKVIPSYNCDINCDYCYNKYISEYYQSDYEKLINNLNKILLKKNINAIVEIIGGEPLSPQNYHKTELIIENIILLEKNIKIVLQTGSSDIEKLIELIPKIDGLSYSIDLSSSPKVRNLEKLGTIASFCKEHEVIIQVQTMLNLKDSIETICQFINLCILHGVGWIGLDYPQYQLYTREELDTQISVYFELFKRLKEFKGIVIGGSIIEAVIDFFSGYTYSSSCMCGEKSITIQPDGSISPSLHFGSSEFSSLDIFVENKSNRERRLRMGNCKECEIWDVCHGGCMGHAKFLTGDIYESDKEFCYLLSGVIKTCMSKGYNPPKRHRA